MNAYTFIAHYWWLIFPVGFMVMSLVRTLGYYTLRKQRLDLINAYAAQGKEIPQSVTDALKGHHCDKSC